MRKILITLVALALALTGSAQPGNRPGGGRPAGGPGGYGGYGGGYRHGYSSGGSYRPRPGGYYMDYGTLEFGVTLNHFTTRDKNGYTAFRPDRVGLFGEYRVDLGPNVDMGLQLATTFGKGSLMYGANPYGDDVRYWQGTPLVVTDINLLPFSGFNPYFGIGIGPGFGHERNEFNDKREWTQSLVISPRAGVELFERLRMSVQYYWYLNSYKYSYCAFGLSWAFEPGMSRGRGRGPGGPRR